MDYLFLTYLSSKATCFGFFSNLDGTQNEGTRHSTKQLIEVVERSSICIWVTSMTSMLILGTPPQAYRTIARALFEVRPIHNRLYCQFLVVVLNAAFIY